MEILLKKAMETFTGFIIIDNCKNIIYANEKFAVILNVTSNELIGKKATDYIKEDLLDHILNKQEDFFEVVIPILTDIEKDKTNILCDGKLLKEGNKTNGILLQLTSTIQMKSREQQILNWIVGKSPSILELKVLIQKISKSHLSIFISGETGVGKEIFAKAIHLLKNKSLDNFIKVDCATKSKDFLKDDMIQNGTIFFDEISKLPISIQTKIFQKLEEKEENHLLIDQVRIICSSNQNIMKLIEKGKFRSDLYYRMNAIEFEIPPLRERKEDIEILCNFFIEKINQENGFQIEGLEQDVMKIFLSYHWPGNIRELKHAIQRLAFLTPKGLLEINNCGFIKQKLIQNNKYSEYLLSETLSFQRIEMEKKAIMNALEESNNNKTKAAQLLNIDRSALYKKLKRYGLKD